MNGKRAGLAPHIVLAAVLLAGCRWLTPGDGGEASLSIATYNVHNLFDDIDDGGEYPEFRAGSGRWNGALYRKRLDGVAEAVLSFPSGGSKGPDILCLQEVESLKVLRDLSSGPLSACRYSWCALGGPESSPIHCAVLSRVPVSRARFHAVDCAGGFRQGRDCIELDVAVPESGRRPKTAPERGSLEFTLFVCHWKSRLEGARETEGQRRQAAALLAGRARQIRLARPGRPIVICGDFNESPDEYDAIGRMYPTALMTDAEAAGSGQFLVVGFDRRLIPEGGFYSPWGDSGGYSYKYKGKEERIDGFLLSKEFFDGDGAEYEGFAVSDLPALMDADGVPVPWDGNSGHSDHLPLLLELSGAAMPSDARKGGL